MSGRVMWLLVVVGAALAAAAAFGVPDPGLSNGLLFGAWLAALLLLFELGLRLPSRTRSICSHALAMSSCCRACTTSVPRPAGTRSRGSELSSWNHCGGSPGRRRSCRACQRA